jgi:cob(I)alamin adenosyltransferase
VKKKTDKKGYIQIYTGDGKGKTTAAIGMAVRAAGHGTKTYIGQFMKGQHYGELTALCNHPFITIEQYGDVECVRREDVTQKHVDQARRGLELARRAILSNKYGIIVLDELNVAVWFDLITTEEVLELLSHRPENMEVVLTGRRAPEELIKIADLVSEVKEIKHYYTQGVKARNGIER